MSAAILLAIVGCAAAPSVLEDVPLEDCEPSESDTCAPILSCCSLFGCWYEVGGDRVPCDRQDCSGAAALVLDLACTP